MLSIEPDDDGVELLAVRCDESPREAEESVFDDEVVVDEVGLVGLVVAESSDRGLLVSAA